MKKDPNTDKNIEKLLKAGFNKEYRPDKRMKEDTLQLLMQKIPQQTKKLHTQSDIIVALSAVWITILIMVFFEIGISIYLLDVIKSAIGLSLILIPVSSVLLIIFKWRGHENQMV